MRFIPTPGALLALLIGVTCGLGGYLAGIPLPWMLGPMIGNTIAALLHLPIKGPDRLRPIVIPIIGVMLGSGISAGIFEQIGEWLLTMALLIPFLICAAGVSFTVYRRIGGYDAVTAFYAAMPGGLNEMLLMGAAAGGDEKRIALAHAARVLIVILFVVLYFGIFLGVRSTGPTNGNAWVPLTTPSVLDYTILGICVIAGVWLGNLARLPAAPVFGPMILSGIAHIMGWVTVAPPTVFVIIAQVVIGTVIGSRFVGVAPRHILRDLRLAIVSATGMLVIAIGFAEVISWASGMSLSQAFLAYSPGGLTEMSLLTLAMDQDVAYVSVTHLVRITLVIAVAPILFRLAQRIRIVR